MKKNIVLTLTFLSLMNFSFSQIKKKDLRDEWQTDKELFYKADTIKFYKKSKSCHQIVWKIERRKFKSYESNLCTEPTWKTVSHGIEKIKLRKRDFGKIIELYQNSILTEKFRIIELNKTSLKLMRFDILSEQKLYKYVDSLIFKALKSRLEEEKKILLNISRNSRFKTYIPKENEKPEPLIVINGYPIENKNILKELLLVETYSIKYVRGMQPVALYGTKAIYGALMIKTSKKRFKKIRKKYVR